MNTYQGYRTTEVLNDTQSTYGNRGLNFLPTISVNRRLKNSDRWIGLTLGYKRPRTHLESSSEIGTNEIGTADQKEKYSFVFFSPSVSEIREFSNLKLIVNLSIPISITSSKRGTFDKTQFYESDSEPYFTYHERYTEPNEISLGAEFSVELQRRIYKNLYFGPRLSFGVYRNIINGTNRIDIEMTEYGVRNYLNYDKAFKEVRNQFGVNPSVNLNYYF